ncbi:hypothetical protein ACI19M_001767 [Escherichia coli]
MATNNFKAFALDPNANVTSQADWEALPALLSGFTAGKASSAQVNKAIRQASFIAAALAQYTANKSGLDVLDDGDLNGFISKMGTAFGKDFQALDATLSALAGLATGANKLPYFTGNDTAAQTDLTSVGRDIIGKNTIADILTYLQLVGGLGSSTVGRLVGVQVITSSGMYTPTPGAKFGIVRGVGGGAGGGGSSTPPSGQVSSAAGGNSGSYGETKFTITGPISVTIGAGGNGGTGSASSTGANIGGAGGDTIFGTIMTCPGGRSGLASNSFTVPSVCQSIQTKTAPCTGANIVSIDGEAGGQGLAIGAGLSGRGGGNPLGSGGNHVGSGGSLSVVGNNGAGYGSGGSGAFSGSSGAGKAGGNGAPGVIIIMEYA